jgi:hypothetical protein
LLFSYSWKAMNAHGRVRGASSRVAIRGGPWRRIYNWSGGQRGVERGRRSWRFRTESTTQEKLSRGISRGNEAPDRDEHRRELCETIEGRAFDTLSHTPRILGKTWGSLARRIKTMGQPFNPTHSVRFELGRGRVSMDGSEARLLVPVDALNQLCASAGPESAKDFGRRIGTELGRRVSTRIESRSSVATMVEHLGGDLALVGLGSLGVEVWGRALVLTVTDCPLGKDGDSLLSAVLEGAIQRGLNRDVAVVPLDREDAKARFLVVSPDAAGTVRRWLSEGLSWGDTLSRLNTAR